MDIDIDLQGIIDEVLDLNKKLTLENIILKKALEQTQIANSEISPAPSS